MPLKSKKLQQEVVQALVLALSAKDPYTGEHSEHTVNLALAMGRELGISRSGLETIRNACCLHDIGKLGIQDCVLNKPDKLTAEEWKEMKLHPLIGAKILKPISFLKDVAVIVEQEHERWDGRGYPFGLKGKDIHVGARIIAIADAYDAITTDRPYHKAQSHDWAVNEINRCSGTQFDPKAVQAFNRALKKGVRGMPLPCAETESEEGPSAAVA